MPTLLSIIIPVYNTEDYLLDCLNSIPLSNNLIEIIIIDDASKEKKTISILNKYSFMNIPQLKIIKNRKNVGVGRSRNKGIEIAKGEYIMFLDSDDKINQNNLNSLLKLTKDKKKFDIIYCKFNKETFPKNNSKLLNQLKYINEKNFFLEKIYNSNYAGDDCWPFLVRTKFLRNNKIFFPNKIRVAEDEYFTSKLFLNMRNFTIFNKTIYIHRDREGSLSSDLSSLDHNIDFINLIFLFIKLLKSKKLNEFEEKIIEKRIKILFSRIMYLLLIRKDKEQKNILKHFIKNNKKDYVKILKKQKFLYLKNLLNIKSLKDLKYIKLLFEKNILNNIGQHKNYFIYCKTLIAKALICCLKKHKKKILFIVDDSNKSINKKYLNLNVINTNKLNRIIKEKDDIGILIANNRLDTFIKIKKKLIKLKFYSNQIFQIN